MYCMMVQPQYCGSCWLHGTLSMIQDRLKIVKKGLGPDVMLARQSLLNCAAFHECVSSRYCLTDTKAFTCALIHSSSVPMHAVMVVVVMEEM